MSSPYERDVESLARLIASTNLLLTGLGCDSKTLRFLCDNLEELAQRVKSHDVGDSVFVTIRNPLDPYTDLLVESRIIPGELDDLFKEE